MHPLETIVEETFKETTKLKSDGRYILNIEIIHQIDREKALG